MTDVLASRGGPSGPRRFIDRVLTVDGTVEPRAFEAHRALIRRCLSFVPVDGAIALAPLHAPGEFISWKLVAADDTCRAIGTGTFASAVHALDDAAALRSGLARATIEPAVQPMSGELTWWAVLDGRAVCVSGRLWSSKHAAECVAHGEATLRKLGRLQLRAASVSWWSDDDELTPQD